MSGNVRWNEHESTIFRAYLCFFFSQNLAVLFGRGFLDEVITSSLNVDRNPLRFRCS